MGQLLYIGRMSRNSRGQPINAPPGFIQPCRPIVAKRPPVGPGWVHELKHDGYRLQIHVRDGRVRLFTMNGNNWTDRYPRIVEDAARLRAPLVIDAEVVPCRLMAFPISTPCIVARPTRMPWPWLLIFFFSRGTISGGSH